MLVMHDFIEYLILVSSLFLILHIWKFKESNNLYHFYIKLAQSLKFKEPKKEKLNEAEETWVFFLK